MRNRHSKVSANLLALGIVVAATAAMAQTRLDSRGLPIGTDPSGNAVNGANAPHVSGPAASPWTQSTNGGTQQVPAPLPPPVTYGGAAAAPGAAAQQLYPAGTMRARREPAITSGSGGISPGRAKLAECIARWTPKTGVSEDRWRSQCRRDFVNAAEEGGRSRK